jgi:hypothetical protein
MTTTAATLVARKSEKVSLRRNKPDNGIAALLSLRMMLACCRVVVPKVGHLRRIPETEKPGLIEAGLFRFMGA